MSLRVERARDLRQNLTEVEKFVWAKLRNRRFVGHKFRRQAPIGNYIADFACLAAKLIVELDGGQHNAAEGREYDAKRTAWLESEGYRVLRFWNHEVVREWEVIEEVIFRALKEREAIGEGKKACPASTPHPQPLSPKGRGE